MNKNNPVRLSKTDNTSLTDKMWDFLLENAHIILPILYFGGLISFVWLCYIICGFCAVESGVWYHWR